jgi:hypothetical protein
MAKIDDDVNSEVASNRGKMILQLYSQVRSTEEATYMQWWASYF